MTEGATTLDPTLESPTVDHLCDRAADLFEQGSVDEAMRFVTRTLQTLRRRDANWRSTTRHPALARLRTILHEDPYTERGYAKPRGYPGDAVLLDYIYGSAPLPDATTPRGRAIYDWCAAKSTAFQSVRARRDTLAGAIDEAAHEKSGARVLAVACGHLREAALSAAVTSGTLADLVALDQDPLSLEVVGHTYPGTPVRTVQASIGALIRGTVDLDSFDVIYAAGLYDYLDDASARALTATLCALLNPGGRLLFANFTDCWEAGYIEATMHWFLVYRRAEDLAALVPDGFSCSTYLDSLGVISYADVRRSHTR